MGGLPVNEFEMQNGIVIKFVTTDEGDPEGPILHVIRVSLEHWKDTY